MIIYRLIEKISRGFGSPDGTVKGEVKIVNCGEYEKNWSANENYNQNLN